MKRKKSKKLPELKKNIKDFLLSEEGGIHKKDIFKAGLFLVAASIVIVPTQALAATHTNDFIFTGTGGHTSHSSHASHASHASHGSHGSHGSHCSGAHGSGW